jgi:diguanylate cyclase (GGDEF)-like protein
MQPERAQQSKLLPQTRTDLQLWIREHLGLPSERETALLQAIETVFTRYERLWQDSKHDAIRAISVSFADQVAHIQHELTARDATVSSISHYFERLVAELTDKSNRDPKTKLTNFARFTEQLESFLALEQRGRWCAVGLVDITGFKRYNDTLGHTIGDLIIERVARLLSEHVRSDDLIAQERRGPQVQDLHARFGGDEFCFLIPHLDDCDQAYAIAERFRKAVDGHDWTSACAQLAEQPVHVDVGVVCLSLGRLAERRFIARRLASALISRADKLMYEAKSERASHINLLRVRIADGEIVQMNDGDRPRPEPVLHS